MSTLFLNRQQFCDYILVSPDSWSCDSTLTRGQVILEASITSYVSRILTNHCRPLHEYAFSIG